MEKQLELKEAATRRKLLALKQQLQAGSSLPSQPPRRQVPGSFPLSADPHSTRAHERPSRPPATAPGAEKQVQGFDYKAVPRSESERLGVSVDGLRPHWRLPGEDPDEREGTSPRKKELLSSTTSPQMNAHHMQQNQGVLQKSGSKEQLMNSQVPKRSSKPAVVVQRPNASTTQRDANTTGTPPTKPPQEQSKAGLSEKRGRLTPHNSSEPTKHSPSSHTQVLVVQSTTAPTSTSSKSVPLGGPQQPSKARLTLPEEVKETEYMTALQRQRARVSRIRRCIVAATVIQRAWRAHRLNVH